MFLFHFILFAASIFSICSRNREIKTKQICQQVCHFISFWFTFSTEKFILSFLYFFIRHKISFIFVVIFGLVCLLWNKALCLWIFLCVFYGRRNSMTIHTGISKLWNHWISIEKPSNIFMSIVSRHRKKKKKKKIQWIIRWSYLFSSVSQSE